MIKHFRNSNITYILMFSFIFLLFSDSYPLQGNDKNKGIQLVKEGELLYNIFKYEEALNKYREAFLLIKSKRNLLRIYMDMSKAYYALSDKVRTKEVLVKLFKIKKKHKINYKGYPRGYLKIFKEAKDWKKQQKILAKEGRRKGRKKFPWLLIIGGIAAIVIAILLLKNKEEVKYTLTVEKGAGVDGTPESGSYIYLPGTGINYSYSIQENYKDMRVLLNGNELAASGTIIMDGDHTLTVSAVELSVSGGDIDSMLGVEWIRIPSGEFTMGKADGNDDEKPVHKVFLDEYYISKYEVTYKQYDLYCDETGATKPQDIGVRGEYPVSFLTRDEMIKFCDWYSDNTGSKIHIPTEAQWEKAARGTDERIYPWGNKDASCILANVMLCNSSTLPVGSYPAGVSPYGVHDMAGNIFEMCQDWYSSNYYSNSPYRNPTGPASGTNIVLRGGDYGMDAPTAWTFRRFEHKNEPWHGIGFRIVKEN